MLPTTTAKDQAPGPIATPIQVCAIEVKSVYGKALAYPDNQIARLLAGMVNRKTLTRSDLAYARALGFEIVSRANADWTEVQ